ncbi:16S rRNA (guanine1207-N2)-methyltransferase [Cytobacillus horneckiae]|uniref:class I SAM-dependent methyltransferase n=1 Tax=Cytobacillus horneckiae TaxID=549687 RepID=UPI0019CF53BB|nr:class I SAM-dependent methyltransferase [Cytobacillus horneckiae]MBN6889656.1 class I SAM-dependent methyltransferase [Cytobacillus horneckiae]MCM3181020.1 class I SAM-dependent methyltransferase [Cytobacillus horneckiae]
MSEHYYSQNQKVESEPKNWNYTLRNRSYRFKTDNGVFSKGEVDFGSKLLIETFEIPGIQGDILDVGCGYGPIGLSMASIMADRTIHMVDVNLRALGLAKENADLNGIRNVQIYESDKLEGIKGNKFAAILTNPPIRAGKKTVHDIFEQSYERLLEGGELWIVIQKKQGAPSAIEKLEQLFSNVETVTKKKGYFILKGKKD